MAKEGVGALTCHSSCPFCCSPNLGGLGGASSKKINSIFNLITILSLKIINLLFIILN